MLLNQLLSFMIEPLLTDSFAEIEDSRCARNTLYPIEEILLLAICGAVSGADDFVAVQEPVGIQTRLASGISAI